MMTANLFPEVLKFCSYILNCEMDNITIRIRCTNIFIPPNLSEVVVGNSRYEEIDSYIGAFLCCFVFITNTLLINGFLRTCKPLSVNNKLFMYLSCIDLLSIPTIPYNFFMAPKPGASCMIMAIEIALEIFTTFESMVLYMIINVLRCVSFWKPFLKIQNKYLYALIFFTQLIPLGNGLVFFVLTLNALVTLPFILVMAINLTVISVSLAIITFCINLVSYRLLKNLCTTQTESAKKNKSLISTKRAHQENRQSKAKKIYALNTLLALNIIYTVSWLPYCLYFATAAVKMKQDERDTKGFITSMLYYNFFNAVSYSNSGINALVYLYRNQKIRKYYKSKLSWLFNIDKRVPKANVQTVFLSSVQNEGLTDNV